MLNYFNLRSFHKVTINRFEFNLKYKFFFLIFQLIVYIILTPALSFTCLKFPL